MRPQHYFLMMVSGFLLAATPAEAANRDEGMSPARGFFLPKGDAGAGRKAFVDLKCGACHWVANEISIPQGPVAQMLGPMIGSKQMKYARGWIANSIVSPSHTIAVKSGGQTLGGELSRMGDYNDTMTVRQLIDIVEYIKSSKKSSEDADKTQRT